MAVDIGHIRSELTTYHASVVDSYLDHFGLTGLPHFEFADSAETEILAYQPGATINSDGLVEYIYNEIPVAARVSDLVNALQNRVLFSEPPDGQTPDPPGQEDLTPTQQQQSRRTRTRAAKAKSKAKATADADADADAVPNS